MEKVADAEIAVVADNSTFYGGCPAVGGTA